MGRAARTPASRVAAVVLAGGAGRRMGAVDKLALEAGGFTLLDRVLFAVRPLCRRLVVVGPRRPTEVASAHFLQEDPPGGGPVPAVVAGWQSIGPADVAFVLAADLPLVTTSALASLLTALDGDRRHQAAAALDGRRRPNPLLAAYRGQALRDASGRGLGPGSPAARLLPEATVVVDLGADATLNVNRPADLRRAEELLASSPGGALRGRPA